MLAQTLTFIVTTLGDLFAFALLARFILQWVRAPARNQLSEFVAALTNFIVIPTRRVIPGLWGLDLATLLLAWLTEMLKLWLIVEIKGFQIGAVTGVAAVALLAMATESAMPAVAIDCSSMAAATEVAIESNSDTAPITWPIIAAACRLTSVM